MHLWLILALLTAFATASQDAWTKKFFSHKSLYEMATYPLLYCLPLLLVAILFVEVPPLDVTFAWCYAASLPLNGVAIMLYMRAIRTSPLSLTLPFLAFTPVFMILTGYLVLGERPGPLGVAGILVICLGGYILNIDPDAGRGRRSVWAPIRAVAREPGSWTMLIVAFIYSFAAVVGKKAILHSSPLFFTLYFFALFNFLMVLFFRSTGKIRIRSMLASPGKGFIVGGLMFLHAYCHALAIAMTQAAYMVAVKRMSIVFGVLYGRVIFREVNMVFRLGGAGLMVLGTVLITLQS
jgi:drug/metabolite transporter (DMT)-like permease